MRRLGVGGGGGGERPVRAQIVVAFVVALTLVAVPLYLMRNPAKTPKQDDAGASDAAAPLISSRPIEQADAGKKPERITLGEPERIRCGAGLRGGHEGSLCDRLPALEEALTQAIKKSEVCAPKVKDVGSINFVLRVDFNQKTLNVFPGASGDWRGPQARRAAECVERAIRRPDWSTVVHQYRHYTIAILARYLPESALVDPTAPPRFD